MQTTCSSSILAALATLKSLSDEKKYQSSYQILGEFIKYIIISTPIRQISKDKSFGFL